MTDLMVIDRDTILSLDKASRAKALEARHKWLERQRAEDKAESLRLIRKIYNARAEQREKRLKYKRENKERCKASHQRWLKKVRQSKPAKLCIICGKELPFLARKYCLVCVDNNREKTLRRKNAPMEMPCKFCGKNMRFEKGSIKYCKDCRLNNKNRIEYVLKRKRVQAKKIMHEQVKQ